MHTQFYLGIVFCWPKWTHRVDNTCSYTCISDRKLLGETLRKPPIGRVLFCTFSNVDPCGSSELNFAKHAVLVITFDIWSFYWSNWVLLILSFGAVIFLIWALWITLFAALLCLILVLWLWLFGAHFYLGALEFACLELCFLSGCSGSVDWGSDALIWALWIRFCIYMPCLTFFLLNKILL